MIANKQGAKMTRSAGVERVFGLTYYCFYANIRSYMTAYQPNPDRLTPQEELGGMRPEYSQEAWEALDPSVRGIIDPRRNARDESRKANEIKYGLSGQVERSPEDAAALSALRKALSEKTLPGMANSPEAIAAREVAAPHDPEKFLRDVRKSWPELDDPIEDVGNQNPIPTQD